jgi:hypothetical protein
MEGNNYKWRVNKHVYWINFARSMVQFQSLSSTGRTALHEVSYQQTDSYIEESTQALCYTGKLDTGYSYGVVLYKASEALRPILIYCASPSEL